MSLIMISTRPNWFSASLACGIKAQTLIITTITELFRSKFTNSLQFLSLRIFNFFTQTTNILVDSWSSYFIDQESSTVCWNSARIGADQEHEHGDGSLKLKKNQVVSTVSFCTKLQGKVKEEDLELLSAWEHDFRKLQVQVSQNSSSLFVALRS